jgi:hypothetical protein
MKIHPILRLILRLILTVIGFAAAIALIAIIPYGLALLFELCFFDQPAPGDPHVPFMGYWTIGLLIITFGAIAIWGLVGIYGVIEDNF